jgi:hypothetical protein
MATQHCATLVLCPSSLQHTVQPTRAVSLLLSLLACAVLLMPARAVRAQTLIAPFDREPIGRHEGLRSLQESEQVGGPTDLSRSNDIVTFLGRWPYGPCEAVAVHGNTAFVGNGALVQAFDLSDPDMPRIVGEYLTGAPAYVRDIQLRDSLAFVCTGDSLVILDIAIPSRMSKVSGVRLPAAYVQTRDSIAYVFAGVLSAVDISDIHTPFLRGQAGGIVHMSKEIALKWPYAYTTGWGLLPTPIGIYNVEDPDSLYWVDGFLALLMPECILVHDTLLLTSGPGFNEPPALKTYSVSDPTSPSLLSTLSGLKGYSVALDESLAFVGTDTGMYAVSISDPRVPRVIGQVSVPAYDMQLNAERTIVAGWVRASVVDVTQPEAIRVRSSMSAGDMASAVDVKDSIAYVASGYAGLWLVSIANPEQPRGISNITSGKYIVHDPYANWAVDVTVSGTQAFVANNDGEMVVYDVAEPHSPRILGRSAKNADGLTTYIAKSGHLAFTNCSVTAENDTIVRIFDVANPSHPVLVGAIRGRTPSYGLAAEDSTLFVGTEAGLQMYDVSNPGAPFLLNTISGYTRQVLVRDTIAYVVGSSFSVVSTARLDSPYVLGSVSLTTGYDDIACSGNFVYLYGFYGAAVIDVSEPLRPTVATTFLDRVYSTGGIAAQGTDLYIALGFSGLYIGRNNLQTGIRQRQQNTLPEAFWLSQNYPNPFNGQTVIQWYCPRRGNVSIEVYNVVGQKVATVFGEEAEVGIHQTVFEAEGLSSGVYFCRLHTQTITLTQPMLHVK